MARYEGTESTDVSNTSVLIKKPVELGATYEIAATTAAIWVNTNGGAASIKGANCIPVPAGGAVNVTITRNNDTTPPQLFAIRATGTDGIATVSKLTDVES